MTMSFIIYLVQVVLQITRDIFLNKVKEFSFIWLKGTVFSLNVNENMIEYFYDSIINKYWIVISKFRSHESRAGKLVVYIYF